MSSPSDRPSRYQSKYFDLLEEISLEFPEFKIIPKSESTLMKVADAALRVITLGQMTKFMDSMSTTVGYTVYVSSSWVDRGPLNKMVTLRHERVHMRQRQKTGMLLFGFLYFLVLPTVFAYYRAKFEKEAYEETMRAQAEYYGPEMLAAIRGSIVSHFYDSTYFWMWPLGSSIEKWYDEASARIIAELPQR